ncbi:hypothetical protein HYE82_11300 [Streptomyces sp. BR123]|uniref:hypothetical protein n=1 Tax=Streptomyces sp. BR123 TaxID=2749828 RepID=UPI0015C475AB|nr:hypothetical protein [Streptomyces sp. BR123]NXY94970.1 hypothetical protein [Streptomyces sp. BR123]
MTQSSPQPAESPTGADETKAGPAAASRGRMARLVREGRTRWVALGVAAAVGGGAAAAVAVTAGHDHHREHARAKFAAEGRAHHGHGEGPVDGPFGQKRLKGGEPPMVDGERGWPIPGLKPGRGEAGGVKAPVPLPALPAAQAVEKAAAAVEGGKVEALRAVPQEGGKSAWLAVVLGPDGVRHAVTLNGEDGTITGNTVRGKTRP